MPPISTTAGIKGLALVMLKWLFTRIRLPRLAISARGGSRIPRCFSAVCLPGRSMSSGYIIHLSTIVLRAFRSLFKKSILSLYGWKTFGIYDGLSGFPNRSFAHGIKTLELKYIKSILRICISPKKQSVLKSSVITKSNLSLTSSRIFASCRIDVQWISAKYDRAILFGTEASNSTSLKVKTWVDAIGTEPLILISVMFDTACSWGKWLTTKTSWPRAASFFKYGA